MTHYRSRIDRPRGPLTAKPSTQPVSHKSAQRRAAKAQGTTRKALLKAAKRVRVAERERLENVA